MGAWENLWDVLPLVLLMYRNEWIGSIPLGHEVHVGWGKLIDVGKLSIAQPRRSNMLGFHRPMLKVTTIGLSDMRMYFVTIAVLFGVFVPNAALCPTEA